MSKNSFTKIDKLACGKNSKCEPRNDNSGKRYDTYERTRAQVYATGNKWAIENFEATHSRGW